MATRPRASNGHGDGQRESIDYSLVKITLDEESLERLADAMAARVAELMPEPAEDRWLNAREAADHLRIHYSTLKERAASGELPAYQDTPNGQLYFKRSELDEHRRSNGSLR